MQKASMGEKREKETEGERGGMGKQYNNTENVPLVGYKMKDSNSALPVRSLLKKRPTADVRRDQGIGEGRFRTLRQRITVFFDLSYLLRGEHGDRGDPTYLEVFNDEMVISTDPDSTAKFMLIPEGSLNVSCARNLNCFSSSLWKSFIGIGTQNLSFQSTRVGS